MAENATGERVAGAVRPPNYRAALEKIHSVEAKKTKVSGIQGEIGDLWAKVEGHGVHRGAAKAFAKLEKMEPAERGDYIRSLNGLMDAAGFDTNIGDLADGNNVVSGRFGKGAGPDDGDGEGDDAGAGEGKGEEDEPASPRRARRGGGLAGLDKARAHFGNGAGAPPA